MNYFSSEEIDKLIKEDVPYFDLTCWSLGIKDQPGVISYFTREDAVICGTEEVKQIFDRMNIDLVSFHASGEKVKAGDILMTGKGKASDLHMAWKVCQNILDHCSGIATKTRKMVDTARQINPQISIFTTRKSFPGAKSLSIKSILAGGALPHRLGISETILIFKQHMNFIGGFEGLLEKLPDMKSECCEKRIIIEAGSYEQAAHLCRAGADGIQFDKMPLPDLDQSVKALRSEFPHVILLAAGGVNETNVSDYAKLPIDGVVTTSLYHAKPIDIGVTMELLQ